MATITRENIGNLNDKLTVNLAKEDYMPLLKKVSETMQRMQTSRVSEREWFPPA
jgi:hypothetical protein